MECNVLYQSAKHKGTLQSRLLSAFAKKDIIPLKNFLNSTDFTLLRTPHQGDSNDEVVASLKALNKDIDDTLQAIATRVQSKDATDFIKEVGSLLASLNLLDLTTLTTAEVSGQTAPTEPQVADQNQQHLNAHMAEFYGGKAQIVGELVLRQIQDEITAAAYYDPITREPREQTNRVLNAGIRDIKAKHFANLVNYLKSLVSAEDHPEVHQLSDQMYPGGFLNIGNYLKALNFFYQLVAVDPDFKTKLIGSFGQTINDETKRAKVKAYKQIIEEVNEIVGNDELKDALREEFGSQEITWSTMFSEGKPTQHYNFLMQYIKDNTPMEDTHAQQLADLMDNSTLKDAAIAYTTLTQFDSIVKENYGTQISIDKNFFNFETDSKTKYSHHQDTSHERKGWQTSEDIGSERHTAKMTKALLDTIPIYDWKTGQSKGKRLDSTQLIRAAGKLLAALRYGSIEFKSTGDGKQINPKIKELKDAAINFNFNPTARLQQILQLLFDGTNVNLADYLATGSFLTGYDISVLKSVYDGVFRGDSSLWAQSDDMQSGQAKMARRVLDSISGHISRNMTVAYGEVVYDQETGTPKVRAVKPFFNATLVVGLQEQINQHMNERSNDKRRELQEKYKFTAITANEGSNRRTAYTVEINGKQFQLVVPNSQQAGVFHRNTGKGPRVTIETEVSLEAITDVDLIKFKNNKDNNTTLTEEERMLDSILTFLDDMLGLNLQGNIDETVMILNTLKGIYDPEEVQDFKTFLEPLLQLGIRAAYVNERYLSLTTTDDDKTISLIRALKNDPLYDFFQRNKTSRIFSMQYGNVKYQIATSRDKILEVWADAQSIFRGEASKSTTKDKMQNSIPNNSVAKLGGNLRTELEQQKGTNMNSLLFVTNPDLVVDVYHDLQVTNMHGESKLVKSFGRGELHFHAIFNKFWGRYIKGDGVIEVQPTVYSDKTTFLNWLCRTTVEYMKADGSTSGKVNLMALSSSELQEAIERLYIQTLGDATRKSYEHTTQKLKAITDAWKAAHLSEYAELQTLTDYRDILHMMSPTDLTTTAAALDLEVELHKDYRPEKRQVTRNGVTTTETVVGVNGLVEYYSSLYNDQDQIHQRLEYEKVEFLSMLLASGSTYQVLQGTDKVSMFNKATLPDSYQSKNPILRVILEVFKGKDGADRINFFNNWVDAETGRLIIAKQGDKNILSSSDTWDTTQSIVLNPLLEKFFYIEGLYSNNLRFSLTGFEFNHPTKGGKSPLAQAKELTSFESWNESSLSKVVGVVDQAQFDAISTALSSVVSVDDLNRQIQKGDYDQTPKVKDILSKLRDRIYLYEANASQGAQFKRNVIIPATLNYITPNQFEGPRRYIRCAAIEDTKASVYNYRGSHEKSIDADDGSARITAIQAILENRALGDQAVGFTKKPIWHAYDAASGTAFLAKLATTTITNESMKASLTSVRSDYNLHKKATNLQWKQPIDLTRSISQNQSYEALDEEGKAQIRDRWFKSVILGEGRRLFYEDQYGDTIEIVGFNKTTLSDDTILYYTEEKKKNSLSDEVTKKYHLFYDRAILDEAGNQIGVETSIHKTVDTYKQAVNELKALRATPGVLRANTINSLFELHAALGGINCVDSTGKVSEFNHEVVVNFMNNVGSRKTTTDKDGSTHAVKGYASQETYDQPLKDYYIGYLFNTSAIKNGAKNINPASSWTDTKELTTFSVDITGLGIQLNADHEVINSELTEFSQVIAATAAYGYTFDRTYEIFQGLARTAAQASEKFLKAVDKFLYATSEAAGADKTAEEKAEIRAKAHSDLYDVIGRLIFVNQRQSTQPKLTDMIFQGLSTVFNKYSRHDNAAEIKVPFSDPSVYSDFVATVATTITKASIKRSHPGSGYVLVPGYNMMQYFEVQDPTTGKVEKLFAPDVLKRARAEYAAQLRALLYFNTSALTEGELSQHVEYKVVPHAWKSNPSKFNAAIRLYVKGHPDFGYFEVVKDEEPNAYSVHFKTGDADTGDIFGSTKEQRAWLYNAMNAVLPEGAIVSTYGQVSQGGAQAIDKLAEIGQFIKLEDTREVTDRQGNPLSLPIYRKEESTNDVHYGLSLHQLEEAAVRLYGADNLPTYYSSSQDRTQVETHYIRTFLTGRQQQLPKYTDRAFFLPSDNVRILAGDGVTEIGRVSFNNDLGLYYQFLDGKLPNGEIIPEDAMYQIDILTPTSLKPSTIRWQYRDAQGKLHYNNVFALDVIRNAYVNRIDTNSVAHRKNVQSTLDGIHKGVIEIAPGQFQQIEVGTLENEAAEVVMSNMYKEVFGIENESLADILAQGEEYFVNQNRQLYTPYNSVYDIAFMKDNGHHTLITLGNIKMDGTVQLNPFRHISTDDEGKIWAMRGNRPLFQIGRWVDDSNVTYDAQAQQFQGEGVDSKDQDKYRLYQGRVQRRVDYVTAYTATTKSVNKRNIESVKQNTLYKIATIDEIESTLSFQEGEKPGDENRKKRALHKQQNLLSAIYRAGDYKLAMINGAKQTTNAKAHALTNSLQGLLSGDYLSTEAKELLKEQALGVTGSKYANTARFKEMQERFLAKEAHKKYVSFLDSLNFISSRIPAQTLQSFMAMKCVGWTQNSVNMAYVSHFQTYLQGSDYDIDKAYIMGQNYDGNSTYVRWSPYFSYTSVATLAASKMLPVPKGVTLKFDADASVDITAEMDCILALPTIKKVDKIRYASLELSEMSEQDQLTAISALQSLLTKVERAGGSVKCGSNFTEDQQQFIKNIVGRHEKYQIPEAIAEAAYKNVASANIMSVSHDIRNRDQAYTAVSMDLAQQAADKSPKGAIASSLNMLNPLAKYEMQHQNIVGKEVVGIMANGVKYWFNAFYYWNHVLNMGTPEQQKRLAFQSKLSRVYKRSLSTDLELICQEHNVRILPDLDTRSTQLKSILINTLKVPDNEVDAATYSYVDQTLSQLLSAATDNAKELILAKINAGTNYAKMYIYLVTQGYSLDDIAAFMYSPIAELIENRTSENIFDKNNIGSAYYAIQSAQGLIPANKFLRGEKTVVDEENNAHSRRISDIVRDRIWHRIVKKNEFIKPLMDAKAGEAGVTIKDDAQTLVQYIIQVALENPEVLADGDKQFSFLDYKSIAGDDSQAQNYLRLCEDLLNQLRLVYEKYQKMTANDPDKSALTEMLADAKEFNKIFGLANEISGISSAWLGLNQGIPSDKASLLHKVNQMSRVITQREENLEISDRELFPKPVQNPEEMKKVIEKSEKKWKALIAKLADSNPLATEDEIRAVFNEAHDMGIIQHFDVVRMLEDSKYLEVARKYVGIIKGTINVIDLMTTVPHYNATLQLLKAQLVSDREMSVKSRVVNELLRDERVVDEDKVKKAIQYIDHLSVLHFLENGNVPIIKLQSSVEGFSRSLGRTKVGSFDLTTTNGIMGFLQWMTHEFYDSIKATHANNGFIKHISLKAENGRAVIKPDIDLINPNATETTRKMYGEMLTGLVELEGTPLWEDGPNKSPFTIADIFQLYNLLVNKNAYGGERLTGLFQVCEDKNSILQQYLKFIGELDYSDERMPIEKLDYQITAAKVISAAQKSNFTDPFIKVKDPVWGYIIERFDGKSNSYSAYSVYPSVIPTNLDAEELSQRRVDFATYYPFEMPAHTRSRDVRNILDFEGETASEDIIEAIESVLLGYSRSSSIIITKLC